MPPCLYICCHCEISDEHPDPASRPRAPTKATANPRRTSQRDPRRRGKSRSRSRNRNDPQSRSHSSTRTHPTSTNDHTTRTSTSTTMPRNQVTRLRHKLEHEDLRHDRRISTLQRRTQVEIHRHGVREAVIRGRLVDVGAREREKLRLREGDGGAVALRGGRGGEAARERGAAGRVAEWLEGLRSVSSGSGGGEGARSGDGGTEVGVAGDVREEGENVREEKEGKDEVERANGKGIRVVVVDDAVVNGDLGKGKGGKVVEKEREG